jgi:hypothetical protein
MKWLYNHMTCLSPIPKNWQLKNWWKWKFKSLQKEKCVQTYEEASPKTFIAKGLVVEKTLALFEEMDRDTTNSSKA